MRAIIVFFDTLNREMLRCYNPEARVDTPNFTRLAEKACKFNNSYVGSMPCIPARRELHTGRYNFLHREWGPIEPFDDSMPEMLRQHGVYTHLVSDHLHYWEDGGATFHTRYSSWDAVRGQEGDHWKALVNVPEIPEVVMVPQSHDGNKPSSLWRYDWANREFIKEEEDFPQSRTFAGGLEFLEHNHEADNWLLHIETFDPHEPFYAPDKYKDEHREYHGRHFDWPRGKALQSDDEIMHVRDEYNALLKMCDANLGKILDAMDRYDMWKDTMLIVGTDHGFLLGEHGYWGKNVMPYYNEIAHSPLFIHDPRCPRPGAEREQLVQMIDWAPTLLSYFGLEPTQDMQGMDLAPVIRDNAATRDYIIYGVFSGHVNITDGRYVYMRAAEPGQKDHVYNYTLMPTHMTKRFTIDELKTAELAGPFSFTKGVRVLKIKAKEKYPVQDFGTLLFDLEKDPKQLSPIKDETVENRMIRALAELMEASDAPPEQYERLGLR